MRYSHGKDNKSDDVWHWINVGMCLLTVLILISLAYVLLVWLDPAPFSVLLLLVLTADVCFFVYYSCWQDEKYLFSDDGIHVKSWIKEWIIQWDQVKSVSTSQVIPCRFAEEADYMLFILSDKVSIPPHTNPISLCIRRKIVYSIRVADDRKAELNKFWSI